MYRQVPSKLPGTWTRGHEGSLICSSALAARAPLRKVGPRLMVMELNQIMNNPNATHCGLSFTSSSVSMSASSRSLGTTGVALRTVVSRLTWTIILRAEWWRWGISNQNTLRCSLCLYRGAALLQELWVIFEDNPSKNIVEVQHKKLLSLAGRWQNT